MRWASWLSFSGLTGNALMPAAYPASARKAIDGFVLAALLGMSSIPPCKSYRTAFAGRGTGRTEAFGDSDAVRRGGNYLHGAHVTKFQPKGQKPVLFMSAKSMFEPGKPIRGGVPICFPWFGARQDGQPGPAHGFARLVEWELVSTEPTNEGGVEIHFVSYPVKHARDLGWGICGGLSGADRRVTGWN